MTDRELLELAAKAAGLCPHRKSDEEQVDLGQWGSARRCSRCGTWSPNWNPLEDDGEALRLAVACKTLDLSTATKAIIKECDVRGVDVNALVRRAIVRAAAEIGKSI